MAAVTGNLTLPKVQEARERLLASLHDAGIEPSSPLGLIMLAHSESVSLASAQFKHAAAALFEASEQALAENAVKQQADLFTDLKKRLPQDELAFYRQVRWNRKFIAFVHAGALIVLGYRSGARTTSANSARGQFCTEHLQYDKAARAFYRDLHHSSRDLREPDMLDALGQTDKNKRPGGRWWCQREARYFANLVAIGPMTSPMPRVSRVAGTRITRRLEIRISIGVGLLTILRIWNV
ncbi:hypothetical protein [Gluconobacter oxydans]|uniref:hypothetical protein n=1 Tax=Gluconobacter oxydans TaxID=442 RepID=UPI0039E8CF85